jgi:hypothetical protein
MPLHAEPPPPLTTTAPYLRGLLRTLLGGDTALTRHIEVETYTWTVMPEGPSDAAEGIAARKPGYDPAELFMDPSDPFVKVRAGMALARKLLGFRYTVPLP